MSGFTTEELLKSVSNYPVAKGDKHGHVFRGNQYSVGGIVRFDPYNALFQTHCAHGHQNTVKVPKQWIQRGTDGAFTGQFASGAPSHLCSTCSRLIDNRWQLVQGQVAVSPPPPIQTETPYSGFIGQAPKNYVK